MRDVLEYVQHWQIVIGIMPNHARTFVAKVWILFSEQRPWCLQHDLLAAGPHQSKLLSFSMRACCSLSTFSKEFNWKVSLHRGGANRHKINHSKLARWNISSCWNIKVGS
jgi:hypothetical protein